MEKGGLNIGILPVKYRKHANIITSRGVKTEDFTPANGNRVGHGPAKTPQAGKPSSDSGDHKFYVLIYQYLIDFCDTGNGRRCETHGRVGEGVAR